MHLLEIYNIRYNHLQYSIAINYFNILILLISYYITRICLLHLSGRTNCVEGTGGEGNNVPIHGE
jgi:hypothetical protein